MGRLQQAWRDQLQSSAAPPRADATAWAIIDVLPALPIIAAPVATTLLARSKGRVYEGIEQPVQTKVLIPPVSQGRRNRWWEAVGLFERVDRLEARAPVWRGV